MKAAYDAGINFFDCAEAYAGGESEKVMGDAIKKFGWKRNDIVRNTRSASGASSSTDFRWCQPRSTGDRRSAITQVCYILSKGSEMHRAHNFSEQRRTVEKASY